MQREFDPAPAELTDLVIAISRRMRTLFNARVSQHGLTYPRARALAVLAVEPMPTQSELACRLQLESATVVRLLDGMEKLDFIERLPVEGDRRAKHVRLTAAGREQAATVARVTDEVRDIVLKNVGGRDIAVAVDVLRSMAAALDEENHDDC